jgi:DNA mismatch repair protein MutL
MTKGERASQLLMLPIEVMLTSDEIQLIADFRDEIEAVGFEFTNGRYTVSVTAIPEGIEVDAVPDMLAVIAERIKSNTGSAKLTRDIIFEKALYQASCKAAIKAGREYPEGHQKWIVDQLMKLPDITFCPHGRPVAMEMSKKNIDRQFERT